MIHLDHNHSSIPGPAKQNLILPTSPRSAAFPYAVSPPPVRGNSSHKALEGFPRYILSPEECPPGDDRRHGCGICNRRFNRPSSLLIHMNSHTGAQRESPLPPSSARLRLLATG